MPGWIRSSQNTAAITEFVESHLSDASHSRWMQDCKCLDQPCKPLGLKKEERVKNLELKSRMGTSGHRSGGESMKILLFSIIQQQRVQADRLNCSMVIE